MNVKKKIDLKSFNLKHNKILSYSYVFYLTSHWIKVSSIKWNEIKGSVLKCDFKVIRLIHHQYISFHCQKTVKIK